MVCFIDGAMAGNERRVVKGETSMKKAVLSVGVSIAGRFV
jgi:hypothetical protein